MKFSKFETFIFDLDGTVWNWLRLYPGTERVIDELHDRGKQVLYVTNNTLLPRKGLRKKLNLMGLEAKIEDVINPGLVAGEYLRNKRGRVLVFGNGFKQDLKAVGVKLKRRPPVKYLAIGHDPKFNYRKLEVCLEALERGATFLSAAKGKYFVVGNQLIPGTGVLVEAIEFESNKKSILMGKPSPFMNRTISRLVSSPASRTVLFGDELNSDIITGKQLGYFTVLVKSGVDKRVSGRTRPDAIISSLEKLRL